MYVRKMGPLIHIGIQKNRVIHILFVEKRGPIIYLAVLKKEAIRHAHPYYAIYRKLPPKPEIVKVLLNLKHYINSMLSQQKNDDKVFKFYIGLTYLQSMCLWKFLRD